jgi:enoyl-CoA hydratase
MIPKRIPFEMIATAQPISAAEASRYGLLNTVVPARQVKDVALGLTRQVCTNAPLAVRESLAVARRSAAADEAGLWGLLASATQLLSSTADWAEGPRAFAEKRAPHRIGQ